jgi:hypothetical protein
LGSILRVGLDSLNFEEQKKRRDLLRLFFFPREELFASRRQFAAAAETSFSIGAPIKLPHSVQEPS